MARAPAAERGAADCGLHGFRGGYRGTMRSGRRAVIASSPRASSLGAPASPPARARASPYRGHGRIADRLAPPRRHGEAEGRGADLGKHWQLWMGSFIVLSSLLLPQGLLGLGAVLLRRAGKA